MYAVPANLLNEIARTETLRFQWSSRLFSLNQQQKQEALDHQAELLEKRGTPAKVARLYQEIGPLLAENEAISRFSMKKGDSQIRQVLPEIATLQQALEVAEMQQPMTGNERLRLSRLLRPLAPD
jgi:hypothetical protein